MARHRSAVPVFENTPGVQHQRVVGIRHFRVGAVFQWVELPFAAREVFQEEIASTLDWLGRHPAFGGVAVHFYDSFRELMEGGKVESGARSLKTEGKGK